MALLTPQELVTGASCFNCKAPFSSDQIEILLLCAMAGGEPPTSPIVLGNPDSEIMFGDPGADIVFGVPP
jgi:hypothetical protein